MSEDPVGFASRDENVFGYMGNNPVNGTDPTGLTQIECFYPFRKLENTEPAVISDVRCVKKADGSVVLRVSVSAGPGYKSSHSLLFDLSGEGTDNDSAQFAARWTDSDGNVVGYYCNAIAQSKSRDVGAYWTKTKDGTVQWETDAIPAGAVHMDIVLIYTDVLYGPSLNFDKYNRKYADVPVIMGYWTGSIEDGEWSLVAHPEVLPQQLEGDPFAADIMKMVVSTATLLREKTGYILAARPWTMGRLYQELLLELSAQDKDKLERPDEVNEVLILRKEKLDGLRKSIKLALRKAAREGRIHGDGDTGWDIIPRNGDPGWGPSAARFYL